MPDIANVFKAEITRLARKESRGESEGLKKAVAAQRTQIASLKTRLQELERLVKQLGKTQASAVPVVRPAESESGSVPADGVRFSAKGLATNRKRLGLSAADFGLLLGVSGASIYGWETGKTKPRPQAIAAIAGLRGVGKGEVATRLAALKAT